MNKASAQVLLTQAWTLHREGNNVGALAAVTQVLHTHPEPAIWVLCGDIQLALGNAAVAAQAYNEAIKSEPRNAGYHHDLARALLASGRTADAETALHAAAHLNPRAWDIFCDLGTAQMQQGKSDDALKSFAAALALNPEAPAPYFNQGSLLRDLGHLDEAEAAFRTAVSLAPTFIQPMISLITLLGDTGRLAEALEWYAVAARIAPDEPQVHQARAMALLRHGQLREGFAAYETRFRPSHLTQPTRPFSYPRWKGEPLAGKRVLIWTEQGVGDEILSAGMFGDVIAAAGACTIECTERVAPLFQRSFKKAAVVVRHDPPDPATQDAFDFQTPSLGLCEVLRQDINRFPAHGGYLQADPALTQSLRGKYRAHQPGAMVIGISWDSAGRHGNSKRLPLALWQPILAQDGITFVSLQYGANPQTPGGDRIVFDHDVDALKDLDAAAAQVAAVDLVITVSNTTAHLAGALGVPVWTLLPNGPGCLWYWFRERLDSPWYPSMRLFRQPRPGAWEPAIADAARALVELKAKGRL